MLERGYLFQTDRSIRTALDFKAETIHYNPTNPGAREYVWDKANQSYYSKGDPRSHRPISNCAFSSMYLFIKAWLNLLPAGIKMFWLDDFDKYPIISGLISPLTTSISVTTSAPSTRLLEYRSCN